MNGTERIAKERQRQITEEGWTPEHDDEHTDSSMALAAALYATPVLLYQKVANLNGVSFLDPWPWDFKWDKRPHPNGGNSLKPNSPFYVSRDERIRQLEKAGALIAAEIDRLLRKREWNKEK